MTFLYIFCIFKNNPYPFLIENFIQLREDEPPFLTPPLLHPDTDHPVSLRDVEPLLNYTTMNSQKTFSSSYNDRVLSITDYKSYKHTKVRQSIKQQQSIEDWLAYVKLTANKPK